MLVIIINLLQLGILRRNYNVNFKFLIHYFHVYKLNHCVLPKCAMQAYIIYDDDKVECRSVLIVYD